MRFICPELIVAALLVGCGSQPVPVPDRDESQGAISGLPTPLDTGSTGLDWVAANEAYLTDVADALWARPEPAHHEFDTSDLLVAELERAGFDVARGVADLPTSFVASYGSGRPIIGIVALLDALPGLSQAALSDERAPLVDGGAGHGCGHHLICAADLGAAMALKRELSERSLPGTIVLVGAPAEEIYHGGVYMVRAGVFDDMDAVLFWHPSAVTLAIGQSGLAMTSVRYRFTGRPSDATDAAASGINALTAAEQLIQGVTAMQFPDGTVVNHVLTRAGAIPSVVTESAEVWYFVHAPDRSRVEAIVGRIEAAARRSSTAIGADLEVQILSATRNWLINERLTGVLHRQLEATVVLDGRSDGEREIAGRMQRAFGITGIEPFFEGVLPLTVTDESVPISDDTAESSWVTPRGGFLVASYLAGIASHTWQWTALGTSRIAHRGMLDAARTLIATGVELLTDEDELQAIRREFEEATAGRSSESPLPPGQGPFAYLPVPAR